MSYKVTAAIYSSIAHDYIESYYGDEFDDFEKAFEFFLKWSPDNDFFVTTCKLVHDETPESKQHEFYELEIQLYKVHDNDWEELRKFRTESHIEPADWEKKEFDQRMPTIDEMNDRFAEWVSEHPVEYIDAFELWDGLVCPKWQYYDHSRHFFSEWLMFDYPTTEDRKTIAQLWAKDDPTLADWVNNCKYTRIRVLDFFPDGVGMLAIDLFDEEVLLLTDPYIWQHDNWAEGSLGVRVTRVGESAWIHVGLACLHDNQPEFNYEFYDVYNKFVHDVAYVIGDHDEAPVIRSVETNNMEAC